MIKTDQSDHRHSRYASLTGTAITLASAQQVLRNIIASQEKRVTIDLIQKRVSEHFNLRELDLKMRSNTRAISFPRQVAMYIVKQRSAANLAASTPRRFCIPYGKLSSSAAQIENWTGLLPVSSKLCRKFIVG